MIFYPLTLSPLTHKMEVQINGTQGRDLNCSSDFSRQIRDDWSRHYNTSAEGANLEQAKPDESLRQKDPAPE